MSNTQHGKSPSRLLAGARPQQFRSPAAGMGKRRRDASGRSRDSDVPAGAAGVVRPPADPRGVPGNSLRPGRLVGGRSARAGPDSARRRRRGHRLGFFGIFVGFGAWVAPTVHDQSVELRHRHARRDRTRGELGELAPHGARRRRGPRAHVGSGDRHHGRGDRQGRGARTTGADRLDLDPGDARRSASAAAWTA